MSYQTIFPDFDDVASCKALLDLGFNDASYSNDTCPSFERNGVAIYVDYADANLSEWAGRDDTRFSVINLDTGEPFEFTCLDHALTYYRHLTA